MRKPSSAGDRGFVAGKQSARKPRRNRKADVLKKENIVSDCSVRSCKQTVKESKKNGGHNSEETLPSERNRKSSFKQSCGRLSVESESIASIRSAKSSEEANKPGIERVKRIDEQRSVNGIKSKKFGKRMRERSRRSAWEEKLVPSISENNSVKSIYGNSGTRENVVERGRSPTPEMRHVGQSRRHHLDVTTGSSNPLASSVDLYRTRTLGKGSETQQKQRGSYDPSRYSDTGDSFSSSRTATTLTEPKPSD